jgi:hypothetical protein
MWIGASRCFLSSLFGSAPCFSNSRTCPTTTAAAADKKS